MPNKTNARSENQVRIIGGEYRSRLLRFPATLQLRPTPDRVRETLFNWLGQDLTGRHCLDLFAGSGALGLEAASRGATTVTMIERDARVVAALKENIQMLAADNVRVWHGDALEFLRGGKGLSESRYDVVFLDPPFAFTDNEKLIARLGKCLSKGAMVYREGPSFLTALEGWTTHRSAKAGAVHYQLLKAAHD